MQVELLSPALAIEMVDLAELAGGEQASIVSGGEAVDTEIANRR